MIIGSSERPGKQADFGVWLFSICKMSFAFQWRLIIAVASS